MKVVSVINYKGGVGKTTVTANIAAQLAWTGRRVLMIDLDAQTNLTFSFVRVSEWEREYASHRTIKTLFDGLMQGQSGSLSDLIIRPERARAALNGSDCILVPTRPDFLSTLGIDYLIRNVNDLVDDYNRYAAEGDDDTPLIQPATIGVMFNMIQIIRGEPISSQATYIAQTRRQSGLNVFPTYIRRNDTLFAGSPETGVPVVLTRQTGVTYRGIVAELEQVTSEFAASIGV